MAKEDPGALAGALGASDVVLADTSDLSTENGDAKVLTDDAGNEFLHAEKAQPGDLSTIDVGTKFDFLTFALSDPAYRTKVKASPMSPIRAAVLTRLVQRYNVTWGFSLTGERKIAEDLQTTRATVHRSIQWLISENWLVLVEAGNARTPGKYRPNFERALQSMERSAEARSIERTASGPIYGTKRCGPIHGPNQKLTKRTQSKRKEVSGVASPTRPPLKGGAAQRAQKVDVAALLKNRKAGRD